MNAQSPGYADVSIVFIVFVSLRPFMRLGVRASASTLSKRWSSVSSVVSEDVPRLSELKTIRELLRAHDEHGLSFRAREVSACWNALGRLVRDDPVQRAWLQQALAQGPELQPLVDTMLHRLPHMNATPVALTAHGVSMVAAYTTFVPSKSILRSMSRRSIRCMEHPVHGPATPPLALSVIAYALARLKVPSHESFATIAHTAGEKLPEFQARNLSNMCWAFAMADFESTIFKVSLEVCKSFRFIHNIEKEDENYVVAEVSPRISSQQASASFLTRFQDLTSKMRIVEI